VKNESGLWLSGLLVGLLVGSISGGLAVSQWSGEAQHAACREAFFREKIEQHNCQPISVWRSGKEVKGIACRLPDGTIIEK
jgi:hypothetical protein